MVLDLLSLQTSNGGVRFVVVRYNGCASLAIYQQMVKKKPFHWGRRREMFLSWIQWIMEKKLQKNCSVQKEIYMVLLSSLRLANNLEGSTSLFEAGQASVEAIFIEGRLGGQ